MKIQRICPVCSKEFYVSPSRLKWGRGKTCSKVCQNISVGKQNSKDRIEFTCLNCGDKFYLLACQLKHKKNAGKWCCRSCRDEYRIGANHPSYIGQRIIARGSNWQSQKRKALKRDNYTCQKCGRQEHINVHHKKPYRLFNGGYKQANRLSNLLSLCDVCHRKEDWRIQA